MTETELKVMAALATIGMKVTCPLHRNGKRKSLTPLRPQFGTVPPAQTDWSLYFRHLVCFRGPRRLKPAVEFLFDRLSAHYKLIPFDGVRQSNRNTTSLLGGFFAWIRQFHGVAAMPAG